MRRLKSIFKIDGKTLKVWESKNKLRGEVYDNNKKLISAADFFYKDGDMDEYRVREYFGFKNCYKVPFERKNGKIITNYVDKQRRVIWSNEDYNEWHDYMVLEEGYDESEISYEEYNYFKDEELGDERANLDIDVDGYIVAFCSLGLWNGRVNGAKIIGTNVNEILYSNCDYVTWFCDPYNVKCEGTHHDGKNYILYRVAETKEEAEKLVNKIAYECMDEEHFRRSTKSLRPYVAKVYGF